MNWGIEVVGLTTDRARALVKLGKAQYLGVVSMPDLFHFSQDLGKAVGSRIGLNKARLQNKLSKHSDADDQAVELKQELNTWIQRQQDYRTQIEQVNKTVHPFDDADEWLCKAQLNSKLLHCLTRISSLATAAGIDIPISKASKILAQIPAIVAGVHAWQQRIQAQLTTWTTSGALPQLHRQWIEKCALPYAYWQVHFNRTQPKARDRELRQYYRQRLQNAKDRYEQHPLTNQLSAATRQSYLDKAFSMARTFQRSSSQVEGRNGYLAFVHHAKKGMAKKRLAVLTVVHNFDIRRQDDSTPAERLFNRTFPDVFEFLCENVTGFAEPRARRHKTLKVKVVQH